MEGSFSSTAIFTGVCLFNGTVNCRDVYDVCNTLKKAISSSFTLPLYLSPFFHRRSFAKRVINVNQD